MTRRSEILAIATQCENANGACRKLDGLIWKAAYPEGDWEADYDGVWMRRDPQDGAAFDLPPNYTSSIDWALSLAEKWIIISLSDIAADGMPGAFLLMDSGTSPPREARGYSFAGNDKSGRLARAMCSAALRAIGEEG